MFEQMLFLVRRYFTWSSVRYAVRCERAEARSLIEAGDRFSSVSRRHWRAHVSSGDSCSLIACVHAPTPEIGVASLAFRGFMAQLGVNATFEGSETYYSRFPFQYNGLPHQLPSRSC